MEGVKQTQLPQLPASSFPVKRTACMLTASEPQLPACSFPVKLKRTACMLLELFSYLYDLIRESVIK
jgi:hypothetical protein